MIGIICWLFGHKPRHVGYTGKGYPIRVCYRCNRQENSMNGEYEKVDLVGLHAKSVVVEVDDRGYCTCHNVRVV